MFDFQNDTPSPGPVLQARPARQEAGSEFTNCHTAWQYGSYERVCLVRPYCPGTAKRRNLIVARHILSLAKKMENVRIGTLEGLWHKMTSFERSPGLLSVGWMA